MNNNAKLLIAVLFAFGTGLTAGNYALSDVNSNYKIAVVNVPVLVESSSQVKALKDKNTKNIQELAKLSETAKAEINKESDSTKQKALKEKYQKEFKTKKTAMTKDYEAKLLEIDKNISNIIETQAKAEGYNLVLAKGAVLAGGTDITNEIAKKVK